MCAFLHEQGCPWDVRACHVAAYSGHSETLRWLREAGCPWHLDSVCANAAKSGSIRVLSYLLQQGVFADAALLRHTVGVAMNNGAHGAAAWLREQAQCT
jgi:hypothetical protein